MQRSSENFAPTKSISISVDVDDLWVYQQSYNDSNWKTRATFFDRVIPHILQCFADFDAFATFFIVGTDLEVDSKVRILQTVLDAGHEFGNHSYSHRAWLRPAPGIELEDEVARTETLLHSAFSMRPRGYRGPGYVWNPELFEILSQRGYWYDASVFPTFWGPISRKYVHSISVSKDKSNEHNQQLFGPARNGFLPNSDFRWRLATGDTLIELPVTVCPISRTPLHMSYLHLLAEKSNGVMQAYLSASLRLAQRFLPHISFLFHPLDFVGGDEIHELNRYPGMNTSSLEKRRRVRGVLAAVIADRQVNVLSAHAVSLRSGTARGGEMNANSLQTLG